jgi:hypothetical protein
VPGKRAQRAALGAPPGALAYSSVRGGRAPLGALAYSSVRGGRAPLGALAATASTNPLWAAPPAAASAAALGAAAAPVGGGAGGYGARRLLAGAPPLSAAAALDGSEWVAHVSSTRGRLYFVNRSRGERAWEAPRGAKLFVVVAGAGVLQWPAGAAAPPLTPAIVAELGAPEALGLAASAAAPAALLAPPPHLPNRTIDLPSPSPQQEQSLPPPPQQGQQLPPEQAQPRQQQPRLPPAPHGWTVHWSAAKQAPYFANMATRETMWHVPAAAAAAAVAAAAAAVAGAAPAAELSSTLAAAAMAADASPAVAPTPPKAVRWQTPLVEEKEEKAGGAEEEAGASTPPQERASTPLQKHAQAEPGTPPRGTDG